MYGVLPAWVFQNSALCIQQNWEAWEKWIVYLCTEFYCKIKSKSNKVLVLEKRDVTILCTIASSLRPLRATLKKAPKCSLIYYLSLLHLRVLHTEQCNSVSTKQKQYTLVSEKVSMAEKSCFHSTPLKLLHVQRICLGQQCVDG